ncbi:hypothetical protein BLL42_27215 (plasmid) [Pseudomonas frederiksbergensis]|uniref:AAA+ ATPase domain-containing protein n=1 Tax=Pseudomonas frederiksbergensis TaxID=104087 RepID=A0A1J0EU42_9PSED|nr:hypothetical protein BLL42_27215 [Pseudomonas frederiksbergensis]
MRQFEGEKLRSIDFHIGVDLPRKLASYVEAGERVLLGGRPGHGKTVLAMRAFPNGYLVDKRDEVLTGKTPGGCVLPSAQERWAARTGSTLIIDETQLLAAAGLAQLIEQVNSAGRGYVAIVQMHRPATSTRQGDWMESVAVDRALQMMSSGGREVRIIALEERLRGDEFSWSERVFRPRR